MRSSKSAPDPLRPSWLGFAHRGLHGAGVPENSLGAFREAQKFTSGAECDVRLSGDGIAMVFHDPDLQRLCGTPERVADSDSSWLGGQLLLDSNETIPTLADLLAIWPPHLPLLIECKTCGNDGPLLAEAVAAALERMPRNAAAMSFDPSVVAWLRDNRPDWPRGLVVDSQWPAEARAAMLEEAGPTFLAVDFRLLGDPWVDSMRQLMPVYSWTVRSAGQRETGQVHADALIWEGDGRP